MRETNQDKNTSKVLIVAIVVLLLGALLLTGCRSKKEVVSTQEHSTVQVEIKRDTMSVSTVEVDSTLHTWEVTTTTTYRPDGTKELEEVRETHREQKAVTTSAITNQQSEEASVQNSEEKITHSNIEVDATPAVKATSNVKLSIWGIVVLALIVLIVYFVRRYFRVWV